MSTIQQPHLPDSNDDKHVQQYGKSNCSDGINQKMDKLKSQVRIDLEQSIYQVNNGSIPRTSGNYRKAFNSIRSKSKNRSKLNTDNGGKQKAGNQQQNIQQAAESIIEQIDKLIVQKRQIAQSPTNHYNNTTLKQVLTIRLKQLIDKMKNKHAVLNLYYSFNSAALFLAQIQDNQFLLTKVLYHLEASLRQIQEMEDTYDILNVKQSRTDRIGNIKCSSMQCSEFMRKCFVNIGKSQLHLMIGHLSSSKLSDHIKSYRLNQIAYWQSLISVYAISVCFLNKFICFIWDNNIGLKDNHSNIHNKFTKRYQNQQNNANINNVGSSQSSQYQKQLLQAEYQKLKKDIDYLFFMLSGIYKITKQLQQLADDAKCALFIKQVNKSRIKLKKKLQVLLDVTKKQWSVLFNQTLYEPTIMVNLNGNVNLEEVSIAGIQSDITDSVKNYNKLKYAELIKLQFWTFSQLQIMFPTKNPAFMQKYNNLTIDNLKQILMRSACALFSMSAQAKLYSKKHSKSKNVQQSGMAVSNALLKLCLGLCEQFLKYTGLYFQVKLQYETRINASVRNQCIRETTRQHETEHEDSYAQRQYYEPQKPKNQTKQQKQTYIISGDIQKKEVDGKFQAQQGNKLQQSRIRPDQSLQNQKQQQALFTKEQNRNKRINKIKKLIKQIQILQSNEGKSYSNNSNNRRLMRSLEASKYETMKISEILKQVDPVTKRIISIYRDSSTAGRSNSKKRPGSKSGQYRYKSSSPKPSKKIKASEELSKIANARFSFKIATESIQKSVKHIDHSGLAVDNEELVRLPEQDQADKTSCNIIKFNYKQQRISKMRQINKA